MKDFKNVPKRYRPIPFWSWNEKLDAKETARQVGLMDEVGMGGFFMHARGGLQTEYMAKEWFENIDAAIDSAKACGMRPWAYDENGWPSGFGNGAVNGLGVKYQQKYLRMEDEPHHADTAIAKCGEHYFYYEINPFYVDTLDSEVISEFIDRIYLPYYEKYGNAIEGFFTDEPQISRNGFPWSFVFEREYQERYGEDIKEHLEELFLEVGDYKITRFRFWKMVTSLFSSAYFKQLYDFCDARGLKLTGHLALEQTLGNQLTTSGACMPHYEYFHIPGVDWLSRNIYDCLLGKQLSSVAAQLEKEATITESFALCGHNVSFDELKGIYEWQAVRGIELLCQHLEGYSIRGIRKRDYPPAMYYQQPWWEDYSRFVEALSRIAMVLNEGRERPDVLVLHPMSEAWTLYDGHDGSQKIAELHRKFIDVTTSLERKHIDFHLGDETIMERHARVENGKIVIGAQSYSTLVMPSCDILFDSTKKLIEEFCTSGGKLLSADELEDNPVIDNENITYTVRYFDDFKVHYFVNSSYNEEKATLSVAGKRLDICTGELEPLCREHTFEPWGSLMIIDDGTPAREELEGEADYVDTLGEWKISGEVENALTLDVCDYYFDGELQEKGGYVLNITERAISLERPLRLKQDYFVNADHIPSKLYLVCETPEKFDILINGARVDKKDCGTFVDVSFRRIDIAKYFTLGENRITFECDFRQSDAFYENMKKARIFESEKNKLAYDMEIEPIYLVGDFSLRTDGEWTPLPRDAYRYRGGFVIDAPKATLELRDIQKQGFPFFCGKLTLEKKVKIKENTRLKAIRQGVNVEKISVGRGEITELFGRGEFDLSSLAPAGEHTLRITLTNNLRNLLGPHHLEKGESFFVCPSAFYREGCVWNGGKPEAWSDDYCFVSFGLK